MVIAGSGSIPSLPQRSLIALKQKAIPNRRRLMIGPCTEQWGKPGLLIRVPCIANNDISHQTTDPTRFPLLSRPGGCGCGVRQRRSSYILGLL